MKSRIFHPIGQGAFYSERINGINVVYDCGIQHQDRKNKRVDFLISSSFSAGEKIDLLFVSHFDCDHVNKITLLHKLFPIQRIVVPLLNDEEKILISEYLKSKGDDESASFVLNPSSLDIPTTLVRSPTPETTSRDPVRFSIESSLPESMESLDVLVHDDWVYVPYNHDYPARSSALKAKLASKAIDISRLTSDPVYLDSKRSVIHSAYNSLKGKINQNSLFLYSGPDGNIDSFCQVYFGGRHCCDRHFRSCFVDRAGCIYTGDGDLNIVDVQSVYSSYFESVGTIQIPHHGDLNSFNKSIFAKGDYLCPISFGVNNSYGHPSNKLIADLLENGCVPIYVTEKSDSTLFEIWK